MRALLKSILMLLLFFVSGVLVAQENPQFRDSLLLRFTVPPQEATFPFSRIEVIDSRPDTSKIGYVKKKNKDRQVIAADGLAAHLEQLLNTSIEKKAATSGEQSVLVVIKKFWLKSPSESDWKRKVGVDDRELKSLWGWHVKLEVYGSYSGTYSPLFRLDSLYGFNEFDERRAIALDAFNHCLRRLQGIDVARLKAAKIKYSRASVDSFNQAAFLKPVLTQASLPTGVFRTFSDFLNNRTVHPEFIVEKSSDVDHLYVFKNHNKELLTDYWGYCDGKKYYIRGNHNFYELYQQGNTFEFIGHSMLGMPGNMRAGLPAGRYNSGRDLGVGLATGLLTNALSGSGGGRKEFRPFQLNIETGEVY